MTCFSRTNLFMEMGLRYGSPNVLRKVNDIYLRIGESVWKVDTWMEG